MPVCECVRTEAADAGSAGRQRAAPSGGNIKRVVRHGLLRPPPVRRGDLRCPRAQAEQKDLSSVWDWQPPGDLGGSGAWTVVRELALTLSRWPPRPPPPRFMYVCGRWSVCGLPMLGSRGAAKWLAVELQAWRTQPAARCL